MSGVPPRTLIITGMHRSGTSGAAAVLQSAGLHVGTRLLGPSPSNVRGHFENLDFVEFHEKLLGQLGLNPAGWTREGPLTFDAASAEAEHLVRTSAVDPAWGFKDPRTVLFLRAWASLLPEACFVFLVRPPWEVVDSLYRRASAYDAPFLEEPAFAVDVWVHYNAQILSFVSEEPSRSLVVSIHGLARHPRGFVAAVNERFGLALGPPEESSFEEGLLRAPAEKAARPGLVAAYRPEAHALYRALLSRALAPLEQVDARLLHEKNPTVDPAALFRDWIDLRVAEKKAQALASDLESTRASLARSQAELAEVRARLEQSLGASLSRWGRSAYDRALDVFHRRVGRPRVYFKQLGEEKARRRAEREARRRRRQTPSGSAFWQAVDPVLDAYEARVHEPARISVLTPTFETNLFGLRDAVESVLSQSTTAWEWCIVDDGSTDRELRRALEDLMSRVPRVRVVFAEHRGIAAATNAALARAEAPYVTFLDHDDILERDALESVLEKLGQGCDVVYTDEDKVDASGLLHDSPFCKPDFSPEYLRGVMYVGHLLAAKTDLVRRVGGLRSQFDGVQDFDLVLRLAETGAHIGHVPRILYHWRRTEGSVASARDAKPGITELQALAVEGHLKRVGLPARAEAVNGNHRVRIHPLPRTTRPLVSLVIPTRDAPDFLGRCLKSLFTASTYANYEVVLMDNETQDPEARRLMQAYPVRRIEFPDPFNYSRANNEGARHARGDYLVFLNNDTEVITPDWIEQLLYYAEQDDVGAVGALLLFPDQTVQHAGIVLGFRGTADHVMRGFPSDADGYAGSLACAREVSAVTGACMMVRRDLFFAMEGFNEHYATHYQDVDFCLTLLRKGRRNIVTPRAVLLHFESATRRRSKYDLVDRMLLLDRWEEVIDAGDPFFNPNFDLSRTDYTLRGRA